jgi:hypothetical protein
MANASTPDVLDRLFARLVRTVRDDRPEYLAGAFEVSELLAFVPYKAVRGEVGVDSDDDYGHAITRLLAGERGLLFVDDLMQDDLRAELDSKNPDLQAYRSYLTSRVTLAQEKVREVLDALGPASPREAPAPAKPATHPAPAEGPTAPLPVRDRAIVPKARPVPSATAPVAPSLDGRAARPGCKYCGQAIPQGREIRFCPQCGQDLSVHRCAACSAELEPDWKFCVSCGRAATQ